MIRRFLVVGLTKLVRGYQLVVSPWFAPTCRYYPSCSQYAIEAVTEHGPLRGLQLATWRLLRCNPWSNGGVDHVPPRGGSGAQNPPHDDPDVPTHAGSELVQYSSVAEFGRASSRPAWRTLHGNL